MNGAVPELLAKEWRSALGCLRSTFAAEFDWKRELRESGLPGDVQELIYRVVNGTRLMRFEKKRIAEELIAHFQDGQDRGVTVASLVSEFGDPAVAAQLIRNSKIRNRSMFENWYRPVLWFSSAGLLGFLGLTIYFYLGKPNPSTDYLPRLNADIENLADADRAWLVYRDSWRKFNFSEARGGRFDEIYVEDPDGKSRLVEPADGYRWVAATTRIGQSAELLEALRAGGVKPAFGLELKRFADYGVEDRTALFRDDMGPEEPGQTDDCSIFADSLMGLLLPHIHSLRTAARLLTVDSRWACEQGDFERATRNVEAVFGISRQAAEHKILIGALVQYSILSQGCDLVDELLVEHAGRFSPEQLQRMQSAVSRVQIRGRDLFDGERLMFHDVVQRVFTDDGNGDGRVTASGIEALNQYLGNVPIDSDDDSHFTANLREITLRISAPISLLTQASRKETVAKSERIFDRLESLMDYPFNDKRYDEVVKEAGQLEGYPIIRLMFPACSSVRQSMFRAIGNQRGTATALAVVRYRRDHRRLPESVDSLVGKYLDEVPVDPLSDKPFRFRLSDDSGDQFARAGFAIYSLGTDDDDDGGTPVMANADGSIPEADSPKGTSPLTGGNYRLDLPPHVSGDWLLWPRSLEKE